MIISEIKTVSVMLVTSMFLYMLSFSLPPLVRSKNFQRNHESCFAASVGAAEGLVVGTGLV